MTPGDRLQEQPRDAERAVVIVRADGEDGCGVGRPGALLAG